MKYLLKKLVVVSLFFAHLLPAKGQQPSVTDKITIEGQVKKEITFTLKDIETLAPKNIPDVTITNHKGESRGTLTNAKGILIKELLEKAVLATDNPKLYSSFYFTFVASDGYKVVYSWNEIFNSPTGDHIYVVTSIQNEPLQQMSSRILVVTPSDFKTGRRFIKYLRKIIVGSVQ